MNSTQITKLPAREKALNEIWALIKTYVPTLPIPTLSKYVLKELTRHKSGSEDKHSRLWGLIFANDKLLSLMIERGINPVLIGYDLHYLYYAKNITRRSKQTYLALVLGHGGDGGKYNRPNIDDTLELLHSAFKPSIETGRNEYFFPDIKLHLNIDDWLSGEHYTTISYPNLLSSRQLRGIESAFLYWKDTGFAVRNIHPENICVLNTPKVFGLLSQENASEMVGLTWEHQPSQKSRQHFFQKVGMHNRTRQITTGEGDEFKVIGWELL